MVNISKTYCNVDEIYERNQAKWSERQNERMKCMRAEPNIDISFATSFTYYSPWIVAIFSKCKRKQKAIVSQWCIRFKCVCVRLCVALFMAILMQEVTISFFGWSFRASFLFSPDTARFRLFKLTIPFSSALWWIHTIYEMISSETTFIWNIKLKWK